MRERRSSAARSRPALLAGLVALAAAALPSPATAQSEFARLNAAGPPLSVPRAELRASLTCTSDLRRALRPPVLLLSGTTVDPDENFAWNWMPALTRAGHPWCASTAPDDNMGDIQVRGEYVAYAIRRMYRRADRRIALFGHSQGGMVGRWALRFWPDTRRMVSDVVGAAPSNQGTDSAILICGLPCAPSFWQQRSDSEFVRALNSRAETFRRISYTNVYSRYDAIVFPNTGDRGRSSLHTGAGRIENVATQEVCAADLSDHLLLGTVSPIAWALFVDAVTHPGPADPERIDRSVCGEPFMPGIDSGTALTDLAAAGASLANRVVAHHRVDAEPPLRDYVFDR